MNTNTLKIAVSGTYSTGKSTTTEALSLITGIPRTHALTSREILIDLLPGKRVEELSAGELIALGLRRLEERVHHEAAEPGSFISDGSVIHEWVYGEARMKAGINPSANIVHRFFNELVGLPIKPFYKAYMEAYGKVVKSRAKRVYDVYIHLPVEFEFVADNHRPVSEPFRELSDKILLDTLEEMKIPYHVVGGTVLERVTKIVELLDLPIKMDMKEAIKIAEQRVQDGLDILENDARHHSNRLKTSKLKKLKYMFRY
jgi:nicotinamide riboside kinase